MSNCYQKSALSMYNTTSQTTSANGTVTYSTVDLNTGSSISGNASTGAITFNTAGLYEVTFTANATTTATSATAGALSLANGTTPINGATCDLTLTSGSNSLAVINKMFRVQSSTTPTLLTLSIINSGANDIVINSANISVVRLA